MERPLTAPARRSWLPLVELALAEDVGPGDLTSELVIPPSARGRGRIEAREPLVACGLFVADEVFRLLDPDLRVEIACAEGQSVAAGTVLMRVSGSLRSVLTAERTALNFLGRMCGIASLTRRYVDEVAGTGCQIVDTRKTLPGWRALDKFAVAAGGGTNHRHALYDGILLKDNHIAAAGGVGPASESALRAAPAGMRVQVEVESPEQAEVAHKAGVDFLLLDNRSPEEVRAFVERWSDRILLEASGGITLENLRRYAETGVQRISLGVLTHSAPASDVALELEEERVG